MSSRSLEETYGITPAELLDAIGSRYRLEVAFERAVAEYQMAKQIASLVGSAVDRYEFHELHGCPDFSIWLTGCKSPLRVMCKCVHENNSASGGAYLRNGEIVAYKVKTQLTSPECTERQLYSYDDYSILGVCLGKKTGDWCDFLFARRIDLDRHPVHSDKLADYQRVPLPERHEKSPWYVSLAELLSRIDDPIWLNSSANQG